MAANIDFLIPEFKALVQELLHNCKMKGIEMIPCETLRSPFVQGSFWRQSRNDEEIELAVSELKKQGAGFLAHCLETANADKGPFITNALPGNSWHQWGEALDCYWRLDGKAIWDLQTTINGMNGYEIYANEAKKLKLNSGFFWTSIKDAVHVQYKIEDCPSELYSLLEINEIMEDFYGSY